jgi:hypothetical protein
MIWYLSFDVVPGFVLNSLPEKGTKIQRLISMVEDLDNILPNSESGYNFLNCPDKEIFKINVYDNLLTSWNMKPIIFLSSKIYG